MLSVEALMDARVCVRRVGGIHDGRAPPCDAFEPARNAMGDTLRFARRMNLIEMEPRDDLSSTGFAQANAGDEYLVLQPSETADPFTVTLSADTYTVEWFSPNSRETAHAREQMAESDGGLSFAAPFEADAAVLYLKKLAP
jgi:hypothetical protein